MYKKICNNLMIGDRIPRFNAASTSGPIKISDYEGKWLILFSHPGDYTPIFNRTIS